MADLLTSSASWRAKLDHPVIRQAHRVRLLTPAVVAPPDDGPRGAKLVNCEERQVERLPKVQDLHRHLRPEGSQTFGQGPTELVEHFHRNVSHASWSVVGDDDPLLLLPPAALRGGTLHVPESPT
jgi:hypothetical protein